MFAEVNALSSRLNHVRGALPEHRRLEGGRADARGIVVGPERRVGCGDEALLLLLLCGGESSGTSGASLSVAGVAVVGDHGVGGRHPVVEVEELRLLLDDEDEEVVLVLGVTTLVAENQRSSEASNKNESRQELKMN